MLGWKSREDGLLLLSVNTVNDLSPFILLSAKECVDCIKDCVYTLVLLNSVAYCNFIQLENFLDYGMVFLKSPEVLFLYNCFFLVAC